MFILVTVLALATGDFHLPLANHQSIEACVSALENIKNEESYCVYIDKDDSDYALYDF